MKQIFYSFCITTVLASSSLAISDADSAYVKLFDKKFSEVSYDLKDQCVLKSEADYAEYKRQEAQDADSDMKTTYSEFLEKIHANGLLDPHYFYRPENTAEQNAVQAPAFANAILAWTESFEQNKMIETKAKCFMNKKEIFALLYYTGDGYRALNRAIRNNDDILLVNPAAARTRSAELEKFAILGKHLNRALEKIKNYQGFVKRGMALNKDPEKAARLLANYEKGNIVTLAAYTSTTIATPFPGELQFLLKVSKNCYYVADYSMYESSLSEEEVLCKPYTKFKVINHVIVNKTHQIYLEEIVDSK